MPKNREFDEEDDFEEDNHDNVVHWGGTGGGTGKLLFGNIVIGIIVTVLLVSGWVWFFWRIEPEAGQLAVLIHKTGKDLQSGKIIATEPDEKGILLDVLSEGRYFRNPYTWDWTLESITDIPAGKLGVLVRLYGEDLKPGQILAGENQKGILPDVLRPGKYRVNPYATKILLFDAINIRPGHIGVVTNLTGNDTLYQPYAKSKNSFLVNNGEKGVQREVLDPGTYYLNPFVYKIEEVSLQSQRFEMSGKDAISFLSLDGFTVIIEGTIEWAIRREDAPMITFRVGDLEDILAKIIIPRARGFSRIEGSKKYAAQYIKGETRQEFQNNLLEHLKNTCEERGVKIISTLIRNIRPPEEIASLMRIREVAVQERNKYEQEIEEAKSAAELAKQEQLAIQNKEKVEQETLKIKAVIEAKQTQSVSLTEANRNLEVAKIGLEAAQFQAEAIIARGQAEHDVTLYDFEAKAKVLADYVSAFGDGWNYAQYSLLNKIGPHIKDIIGEERGIFGKLFEKYYKRD